MLAEGTQAPAFELPGTHDGETDTYALADSLAADRTVLLLFYPFDFSPVCTTELCAIRDAEWFQFTDALDVWAISGDSVHAHEAFAREHALDFPLLSDYHATTASAYDVRYDALEGHEAVPKRAVYVIDPDGTITYAWATDVATERPDFDPITAALERRDHVEDAAVTADVDEDSKNSTRPSSSGNGHH